jgi:hypothetical protein
MLICKRNCSIPTNILKMNKANEIRKEGKMLRIRNTTFTLQTDTIVLN